MLNTIAMKQLSRSVIHADWDSNGDRSFRVQQPAAQISRNVEVIGNEIELITRHLKRVIGVDVLHRRDMRLMRSGVLRVFQKAAF